MLHFWKFVWPSVVGGFAVYLYAQTDSVYLLITVAWFAGFVTWNIFEALLQTLSNGTGPFERQVATHQITSIHILGLVVGIFSVAANSTIESHWFLLVHGIFWIIFALFLLFATYFGNSMAIALLPANREAYFRKVLHPAFDALGVRVRNVLTERPEMNITSIWRGRSFAFIDVMHGPIRWLNCKEDRNDESTRSIEYGVPTFDVGRTLPKVRIRSKRVRSVPMLGEPLMCAGAARTLEWGSSTALTVKIRCVRPC